MCFFGTHNYGWVPQSVIYRYVNEDKKFRTKNEKKKLEEAIDEAEQWMDRYEKMSKKNTKSISKTIEIPRYHKIKRNKISANLKRIEFIACECRPDDPAPCSIESSCYNATLDFECDPDLCPARDKCQNKDFHRGEQFALELKMTPAKGWGLYTKEVIPNGKFIIEYMGEIIGKDEFDQRFNRTKTNLEDNYYFLSLEDGLYIDAALYGNRGRFINHSCEPNITPNK